jgi:transcriptional regulator with XRE-family HTH domain
MKTPISIFRAEVTAVSNAVTPISKRELLAYQANVKGAIFRQIREAFSRLKQSGFTQKDLAAKIGMDEGQLSRRLRGDYDLRLETLSDLARGLDCRIDVKLAPISVTSVLASDHVATAEKSIQTTSISKRYHEMINNKIPKERSYRARENFALGSSKPPARRCKEHIAMSDARSLGKRPLSQSQLSQPWTKKSSQAAPYKN